MIPTLSSRLANKVGISSEIELVSWMQRPYIVQNNLDQFLRGQQRQFIQPQDKYETGSINSMLFHGKRSYGDDLEAISIQRQRDFGMPCYNDFRAYSNLPRAKSFEDLLDVMTKDDIEQLKSVYSSVDLIDLYVGGLYERPTKDGGLFGPTFRNLVAEQFYRWKHGDRYFLTFANQSGSFTLEQLDELRKTSSGWLFCQGGNDISLVHPNNMNKALPGNGLRPCSKLPQLDLTKWKV
ncbi:hypothetical protein M8J77_010932 [Diaphorina citri]|nr:hypothetical protein M8J77_010932 [Diaphorina citri]